MAETTLSDLTATAQRAQASGRQADADQAQLRRTLVALDRQDGGPSRNELARMVEGALSRRLVLNTLQAADTLRALIPLLPTSAEDRPIHEDGLDLLAGRWHAQARTSGHVVLSLVPDIEPGDGLETERGRRRVAERMLARLKEAGFEVLVKQSAGLRAVDELADWGQVYLTQK
ncbi:hypothetical protein [Nocardiopsis sp. NPDC006938]|uniref:hypothetical protein n=1 Tax=Nocardiopsis sp. NPDC006938 TaxID=3364337 RepID=UPI00367E6775